MAGATAEGSERSAWRAPVAVAVLLGLVGVVAIAATGRAPARGESSPSGHPPTLLIDYLSTIAVLFVPAGAILIVWAGFMRRMDRVTGKNKGSRRLGRRPRPPEEGTGTSPSTRRRRAR